MALKTRIRALGQWAIGAKNRKVAIGVLAFAVGVALFVAGKSWIDKIGAPEPAPVDTFTPAVGDTGAVLSLQTVHPGKQIYHRCTATLITNQTPAPDRSEWAVTAASCVTQPPERIEKQHDNKPHCDGVPVTDAPRPFDVDTAQFTVRGASNLYAIGGQTAAVTEIHVATGWNWRTTSDDKPADDLALLRLDHPLNITPVPVATAAPQDNAQVIASGWSTRPDRCGNITSRMQQWPIEVDTCQEATDSDICASTPEHEVAPCEGGSGAPLFTVAGSKIGSVAGVYSLAFGDDCHGPTPVLFTSLARYRNFITTTMSK